MKKTKYLFLVLFVAIFIAILPSFASATKVNVDKVKGLKLVSNDVSTISIKWKKVNKASGYKIYIYNSSKKKYEYKAKTKNNSYEIKKLKSSQEYKIRICAYRDKKNKKYYGKNSSVLTIATKPEKVKNIKLVKQTDNSLSISWQKVPRATAYKIYIYNEKTKKYEDKLKTNKNSTKLNGLTQFKEYKIKVRALKNSNKKNYYGSYSDILATYTKLSKITGLKTYNASLDSINLKWDVNPKAMGYRIYMYDKSSKSFIYKGETTEHQFTISNLNHATGYSFKVRAYNYYNNSRNYGAYSDILDTATYPKSVLNIKVSKVTTSSIKLVWDRVENATGYAVYLYSESKQNFDLYQTITTNSIDIKDLDAAKFYKIYIKSYVTIKDRQYYSKASEIISQKTTSTVTSKAGIDVSKHQEKIDWDKVKKMGVDFAVLRLGWIGNNDNHTLDEQFERNYDECKKHGIPIGVYVYCYSKSVKTAKEGAVWTVENLKGKTLDLPVFIDMEDSSIANAGRKELSNICVEFNKIISKAKFTPGIYANRNWFDNYLEKDLRTKYICWIAHYTSSKKVNYEDTYQIWQYSSDGVIDGIKENVDLNIMYVKNSAN